MCAHAHMHTYASVHACMRTRMAIHFVWKSFESRASSHGFKFLEMFPYRHAHTCMHTCAPLCVCAHVHMHITYISFGEAEIISKFICELYVSRLQTSRSFPRVGMHAYMHSPKHTCMYVCTHAHICIHAHVTMSMNSSMHACNIWKEVRQLSKLWLKYSPNVELCNPLGNIKLSSLW